MIDSFEITEAFVWIPWLIGGIVGMVGLFIVIGILAAEDAKNIAILGMDRSGKSTLWEKLGGPKATPNTQVSGIPEFQLTRPDGSTVTIKRTKDIGGGDGYVRLYDELIIPSTFVYFLVDITRFEEKNYALRMRSNLTKIGKVLDEKKISNEEFGFKIIITHCDIYRNAHPEATDEYICQYCIDKLKTEKLSGKIGETLRKDTTKFMMPVNLMDNNDINRIKMEIKI